MEREIKAPRSRIARPPIEVGQRYGLLIVVSVTKTARGDKAWNCKCDCGGTTTVTTGNLYHTKSCGCLWRKHRLTGDEASFRYLFKRYRANSGRRQFALTEEEFRGITSRPCFYCGDLPSQTIVPTGSYVNFPEPYTYNGIDRRDNEIGYVASNCVASCKTCNFMKGQLSCDQFIEQVRKIAARKGNTDGN
jgi:hypothetical protein